jgi:hypothetical protein
MATQNRSTRRTSPRAIASASRKAGEASLERLNASLEAAQKALSDLSAELGRGGRDLLKNAQRTVNDASRNARRLNKSLRTDLDKLQEAVTQGKRPKSGTASKAASTRRTATARKAAAKRTASKRTTRPAARKSGTPAPKA